MKQTTKAHEEAPKGKPMKAIVYREYGAPDVLRLEELDKPAPKENEVLIKVRAAEATKSDCEMRSSTFPAKWLWLPIRLGFGVFRPRKIVLGGYFAGVVEAVGANVTAFTKGDESRGAAHGCYDTQKAAPDGAAFCVVESTTKPF